MALGTPYAPVKAPEKFVGLPDAPDVPVRAPAKFVGLPGVVVVYVLLGNKHCVCVMEYTDVLRNLKKVYYNFPNKTNSILNFNKWKVLDYINNSYPLCNRKVYELIKAYIKFIKKYYGGNRHLNCHNMVDKLLKERPLYFYTLTQKCFFKSSNIDDYVYDSVCELSLFLGLSVVTDTMVGNTKPKHTICVLQCGVYLHKRNLYDWKYLVVDKEQNTYENGYGADNITREGRYKKLWSNFYGVEYFPLYSDVDILNNPNRYLYIDDSYLDMYLYKKRLLYNIEVFLKEADYRGSKSFRKMCCYVDYKSRPCFHEEMEKRLLVEVYMELLSKNHYKWIGELCFSGIEYFPVKDDNVRVVFTKKPFWDYEDVVVWCDWNINSYPCNEYWVGGRNDLGDYTMVPWIGNSDINNNLVGINTKWI